MSLTLRHLGAAARLAMAGDFAELGRRVRLRLFGPLRLTLADAGLAGTAPAEGARQPVARVGAHDTAAPIRCVAFSHNLNREGAPISQFELIRGLVERGVMAAEVFAFGDGPLREAYRAAGIPVTVLPACVDRVSTCSRLDGVVAELGALIGARAPDVVYANTLLSFCPVLAAAAAGVPSVWNLRESEAWQEGFGFLNRDVARRALSAIQLPAEVVFVAEATRQLWAPLDRQGRFSVVRNGLDPRGVPGPSVAGERDRLRRRLGWSDTETVFLCVGTLCERKGQRDLVRAFGRLAGEEGTIRICLVGDAEPGYGRRLRRDVRRLTQAARRRVDIHASRPDVQDFYAAADAFVLCSRQESYPRVVIEALAHGMPVLATPVFGVREQLAEGSNALVFEPGDAEALAGHMGRLVRDRGLRSTMSAAARAGYEALPRFDEMLDAYAAVFRRARGR